MVGGVNHILYASVTQIGKAIGLRNQCLWVRLPPEAPTLHALSINKCAVAMAEGLSGNGGILCYINGRVAKLADAQDLKSWDRNIVSVQVRPCPPSAHYFSVSGV